MKRLVYLLIFPVFLALVFSAVGCGPQMSNVKMANAPCEQVKETPPPAPAPAPAPEPKEERG